MIADVLVNASLLIADTAILLFLRKRPKPAVFLGLLAAGGIASIFLSFILGGDSFGMMRVLAWAIFVHGVVVLAGGAIILWKPHRKPAIAALAIALVTVLVGADAFFVEPHWLEVTRVKISSPKVSRRFTIAVVADLQTDGIGDYERQALERVAHEKPDLILFAGDYIQEHDPQRRKELMRELRDALRAAGLTGLKAAMAVEGNCDSDDWPAIFEKTGIAWTKETRTVSEGDLQITGLSLADSFNTRLAVPESERFHIALGHAPDFALGDVKADLLIAGHTHGGQVRLPGIGPLITLSSVPRSWAAGVTRLEGGRTLLVSRGIGMERGRAPRLRFLCRPQLVFVDVAPGQ